MNCWIPCHRQVTGDPLRKYYGKVEENISAIKK